MSDTGNIGTVAVTGASGFVGRYVVRELLGRGVQVRALVRDRARAGGVLPVRDGRLALVEGNVLEGRSAGGLVDGCSAALNLVGIIREEGGGQTFKNMHVEATRVLVEACKAAGVRRFVQMSALGVGGDGKCAYQRTKWEGEQIVRRSGLDWTIFRPGMIHGAESKFIAMAAGWVSGQSAPFLFIPYFSRWEHDTRVPAGAAVAVDPKVQPIAVEDVARAFVECLFRPQSVGEVYPLAGPDVLSWPDLLKALRDHLPGGDPALMPWPAPSEVAWAVASAAGSVGLGGLLPFDAGMARMGGQDSTATLDKARYDLGLELRPFLPTLKQYAASV
jgi:NADH dehydrogenase